jgi:type VI secretion system protein
MSLKLRVISEHHKALGKRSSKLFGVTGGRIGRAQDNDWVLPDPDRYVSSHHCKIVFRAGKWILEDTSTNGVFINGSDAPSSLDGPYSLLNGDRIRLGEYEISVSIDEHNDFSSEASGQLPIPARVAATGTSAALGDDLGEELDLTDLLQDPNQVESSDAFNNWATEPADADSHSIVLTPAQAKAVRPAARPIAAMPRPTTIESLLEALGGDAPRSSKPGDDWQMQTRPYDRATMTALTQGARLSERRRGPDGEIETGTAFEAFCRGAGIEPSAFPTDAQNTMLTLAGQMIREAALGLMDAHKSRSDLKHRLRLTPTPVAPNDPNPLKTANSVDEAVLKLLDPHVTRQLGPVEAIRDSLAEHRTHQAALVTAIHAGIDELMKGLEPRDLQERFDRGLKRGALLGATNKMKYWDLFVDFFQVVNQRNEQGLPALFAEELARTYAERSAPKKK